MPYCEWCHLESDTPDSCVWCRRPYRARRSDASLLREIDATPDLHGVNIKAVLVGVIATAAVVAVGLYALTVVSRPLDVSSNPTVADPIQDSVWTNAPAAPSTPVESRASAPIAVPPIRPVAANRPAVSAPTAPPTSTNGMQVSVDPAISAMALTDGETGSSNSNATLVYLESARLNVNLSGSQAQVEGELVVINEESAPLNNVQVFLGTQSGEVLLTAYGSVGARQTQVLRVTVRGVPSERLRGTGGYLRLMAKVEGRPVQAQLALPSRA